MKIHKLLMVEPKSPGKHVFSIVRLPRLGMPILGTLAHRLGYEVEVVIEEIHGLDFAKVSRADLLCVSTTTSTAPAAYRLADRARAAGVTVALGGPHVTFLPDEALAHADWVVRGEAEHSFPLLLDMLEGRIGPAAVPGLSWQGADGPVHNPLPAPVAMDEVPIPDFSLLSSSGQQRCDRGIVPIQTSRGCPHQCNFCSVTPMFGRKMRFASNEHVAEELERARGVGDKIFFYDDNFCGSPGRTKALLDHLLTRGIYLPRWFAQVSVRAARDPELLRLMQRAGCYTVFVGFESIDPEALDLHHKRQTVADIRHAIRAFQQHDIWVHGMFMTGSDAEGVDNIRATARFAIEQDIDTIQFLVLTPLPGTPFYEQMRDQGRLLTRDWSQYDAHHAVFRPARLSAHQLMAETMAAMGKVYGWRRVLGPLFGGRLERTFFRGYAHMQVRRWRRENRARLRAARLAENKPPAGMTAEPDSGR